MHTRLLAVLLLAFAACVSEDRVRADWDTFVAEHNTCAQPADCALVYPGCPLGCATAVQADAVEEAGELAESLIQRYERGGQACDYDCAAFTVDCQDNVCVAVMQEF